SPPSSPTGTCCVPLLRCPTRPLPRRARWCVCAILRYRTLCTLRSSVRSTVPWRHLGPKPAASRSPEPVTSCASPGADLSADGWATPDRPARRAYLRPRIREGSRRANLRMPPRTRRSVLVAPADMACDKVVTNQIAAYAPVRANGHAQARPYSHTLRRIASVPTITSHQHSPVRAVWRVLSDSPPGTRRARTGFVRGDWSHGERLSIAHRGAHRQRDQGPSRPLAPHRPRSSPSAERQRPHGLAPDRRWHPSRRPCPRRGPRQR